ncbi:MAG: oxygen-dependent coproporphyrinogen oxidase [Myxococcota bacterium]
MRQQMVAMVSAAQAQICEALGKLDPIGFREDSWERPGGGGGLSQILQEGDIFEKAGVNVSKVHGILPLEAMAAMAGGRLKSEDFPEPQDRHFFATGLSVVIHPHNPMAPTAHCNYRYFELGEGESPRVWWFGGGADLTPSYLFDEDAAHFHGTLKKVCDDHDSAYYDKFKRWCDTYFRIPHREESRGVGGIFFDHLNDRDSDKLFAFVQDCAAAFVPAYVPLVQRRMHMAFTEAHKRWQGVRRGRYVEFNLLYDRGTAFGLRTAGRTQSILMSLPLSARWEYDDVPAPGSAEASLVDALRQPRQWA